MAEILNEVESEAASGLWSDIAASTIATMVRESVWAYPMLETVHIIGLALVFGSILAFDLRILGLSKALPVRNLGQHLLPWVWTGFALNAVSGLLLFMSDAVEFAANPALRAKLALLALAGLNAYVFQARYADATAWNEDASAPAGAKVSAIVSIILWLAVITAGRMIAYIK